MNRPDPLRSGEHTQAGGAEGSIHVPVRRSRWVSFWVGVGAALISLLTAAALTGLLLLLPHAVEGAWVVIIFGALLFGLFFLSVPWQKRYGGGAALGLPPERPGALRVGAQHPGGGLAPLLDHLPQPARRLSASHFAER